MSDDLSLAERLADLARSAGAEAADVLVVTSASAAVGVSGRALEEAERSESRDVGLRVLVGRRQASVASSDVRDEALREMAARAVAMAAAAPEDPFCGLAEAGETADPAALHVAAAALELEDPEEPPAAARLEETALEAEAAALAVAGVGQVEQASASWSRDRVTLFQTNGFHGSYGRSGCGVSVSAIAGSGLGRERDWAAESRRHRTDLPDHRGIGRLAGERAVARLSPRRPPAGRHPVIYDERVSAGLIGHVLSAINGLAVARGASWLAHRLGERILPEGFDVIEDPLIPRGRASRPFDAEGIAARRKALVEDGVLRSWVLDLATARQLGLSTTGNARRGVGGPPSPGTTNIRVTGGPRSREDLIAEVGRGLLVTSFIGASINPTTGAYSRGASGFWIEGGEIAYPVNEITLAGSLPEMIRTLRPANDADPWKAVSVPSMTVEGLTIGA